MTKRITGICRNALWRADLQADDGSGSGEWRLLYKGKTYPVVVDDPDVATDAQVRRAVEQMLAGLDRGPGPQSR